MKNEEIFRDNIVHYPKILLIGNIIHIAQPFKKYIMGFPINEDERFKLIQASMTYVLIADLAATKENNQKMRKIAETEEVPKFGFKTIRQFQEAWDIYGVDYFRVMNEASQSVANDGIAN